MELDANYKREELNTSWAITVSTAQEAGIAQGRSNGYFEALGDVAPAGFEVAAIKPLTSPLHTTSCAFRHCLRKAVQIPALVCKA